MRLNVHIHKIKSIDDLTIALPVDKGLYAITGAKWIREKYDCSVRV